MKEVARRHVEEDFGGCIPTVEVCFRRVSLEPWMEEARGFPTDALAARRFGGIPEDYGEIRRWFEEAEARCRTAARGSSSRTPSASSCANRGSARY